MASGVARAKEERRQFSSLKEELKRLSREIDAAKVRLASFQFDEKEAKRLTALIDTLTQEERRLNTAVAPLERAEKALERKLATLNRTLEAKEKEYKDVSALHGTKSAEVDSLEKSIADLKERRDTHKSGKDAEAKKALATIESDVETARGILRTVNKAVTDAKKEAAALAGKRADYKTLCERIADAEQTLRSLEKSIADRDAKKRNLERHIEQLDQELAAERKRFEDSIAEERARLTKQDATLTARAGNLDFFFKNLEHKARLLTQAKGELEEFHGKPLRHIIIPTIAEE